MRRRPVLGIMLTLTFLLLAGCGERGIQVHQEVLYEHYPDSAAMLRAADLVVKIDGSPSEVEQVVEYQVPAVTTDREGVDHLEFFEAPVFQVRIKEVIKGSAEPGDTILVTVTVDHYAGKGETGQTWLFRNSPDSTLYLYPRVDDNVEAEGGIWATISMSNGIEPAED